MPTEGQRLKALADQLKREKKTSRKEIADKMGITKEHLSAVFNKDKLTPEIKERAIKGLQLPPDFFEESAPPPTVVEEPIGKYGNIESAPLSEQVAHYKTMFERLQKKYILLLEKMAGLEEKKE